VLALLGFGMLLISVLSGFFLARAYEPGYMIKAVLLSYSKLRRSTLLLTALEAFRSSLVSSDDCLTSGNFVPENEPRWAIAWLR